MVRVGIIGCGAITASRHAPEYAANPHCEIAAFYDFNHNRAAEMAKKYGGKACDSLEELLTSDLDAVSVCVRNDAHYSTSVQALEAGKHVLCEKPMAMTSEDCRSMVAIAREKGLNLMVGLNHRFLQPHVKAKELIAGGAVGKVLTFESHFCHAGPDAWTGEKNTWFFDKSKAVFGVMADLGIHKTDVLSYIIGQEFTETTAVLKTVDKKYPDGKPIDVEDNALCVYRTAEGVLGLVNVSWTNYGTLDVSTIIKGTEGILRIYADEQYPLILERRGSTVRYQFDDPLGSKSSGVIDEFIASIEEKREPLASGASALHGMMAIFANAWSAELGRTVPIER